MVIRKTWSGAGFIFRPSPYSREYFLRHLRMLVRQNPATMDGGASLHGFNMQKADIQGARGLAIDEEFRNGGLAHGWPEKVQAVLRFRP